MLPQDHKPNTEERFDEALNYGEAYEILCAKAEELAACMQDVLLKTEDLVIKDRTSPITARESGIVPSYLYLYNKLSRLNSQLRFSLSAVAGQTPLPGKEGQGKE